VCISCFRLKIAKQGRINPAEIHFLLSLRCILRIGVAQRIGCRLGPRRYTAAMKQPDSSLCPTRRALLQTCLSATALLATPLAAFGRIWDSPRWRR